MRVTNYFSISRLKITFLVIIITSVFSTDLIAELYTISTDDHGRYDSFSTHLGHDNTITELLDSSENRGIFSFTIPPACASGVRSAVLSISSSSTTLNQAALSAIEASAEEHRSYALALNLSQPVSPELIMKYSDKSKALGELQLNCEPASGILVTQTLINNNNGTATEADFIPMLDSVPVVWDVSSRLFSGNYNMTVDALAQGYSEGVWGGDCAADGSIHIQIGQIANCTLTSDDIPATLTIKHTVLNKSGGTALNSDFDIYINGVHGVWDVEQYLDAGSHSLIMSSLDGYKNSQWQGDCSPDGSIKLALAQNAVCEIVSTDLGSDLILNKSVNHQTPNIGDNVTFTITVSNRGPDPATNVKVVDVVLPGLEYQPGSILGTSTLSDDTPYTDGLKWTIDYLPVGVLVDLSFDAKVLLP